MIERERERCVLGVCVNGVGDMNVREVCKTLRGVCKTVRVRVSGRGSVYE